MPITFATDYVNRNYYRDVATYIRDRSLLRPLGVAVTNAAPTVAEDVYLTMEIDAAADIIVLEEDDIPAKPSTSSLMTPRIRNVFQQERQRVHVRRYAETFEIRIRNGNVQPKTTMWSEEPFFVGAKSSMKAVVRIQMSANNLRAPSMLTAEIDFTAYPDSVSVEDLVKRGKATGPR